MINVWIVILKREFLTNIKFFFSRVLFVVIILTITTLTIKNNDLFKLVILFVDVIFLITYFIQLYLQQLKDKGK